MASLDPFLSRIYLLRLDVRSVYHYFVSLLDQLIRYLNGFDLNNLHNKTANI